MYHSLLHDEVHRYHVLFFLFCFSLLVFLRFSVKKVFLLSPPLLLTILTPLRYVLLILRGPQVSCFLPYLCVFGRFPLQKVLRLLTPLNRTILIPLRYVLQFFNRCIDIMLFALICVFVSFPLMMKVLLLLAPLSVTVLMLIMKAYLLGKKYMYPPCPKNARTLFLMRLNVVKMMARAQV